MKFPEYLEDFSAASAQVKQPVLYFYGLSDWMVGPESYRYARFPNLMLWPSEVGHVAVMENQTDLETAIEAYQNRYVFHIVLDLE